MKKICTKCKRNRPLDKYSPDKRATDGKTSECTECMSNRKRAKKQDVIIAYIFPD